MGKKNLSLKPLQIIILSLSIISSGASAQSVEPFGLEGKIITALATSPSNSFFPPLLCAGTESSGVYLRNLTDPDSDWVYMGLKDKRITSVCIYWWGAGPGEFLTTIAGIKPTFNQGDSTFIYCRLIYPWVDTTWIVSDSGIDTRYTHEIRSIDGFFFGGHAPPQPVFACGSGRVFKTSGFLIGESWKEVWSMDLATTNIIQVVQPVVPWGGPVWVGGEIDSSPYLIKSTDYGDTWQTFYPSVEGTNACYSIAVHPEYPETVYAGMKGTVIKTTNGGALWEPTELQDTSVYFYGLAIDPSNPEHLYAGGASAENAFAMYETFDGGREWQPILPFGKLKGISSLAIDPHQCEIIYIGTLGTGVLRYRGGTGMKTNEERLPLRHMLYQNYPNPFNSKTTIEYTLPQDCSVKLTVHNILGQEVASLVDDFQKRGHQRVDFNGVCLPSGLYFYRLQAGDFVQTRKMLLIP